jgi:hypothetical protein
MLVKILVLSASSLDNQSTQVEHGMHAPKRHGVTWKEGERQIPTKKQMGQSTADLQISSCKCAWYWCWCAWCAWRVWCACVHNVHDDHVHVFTPWRKLISLLDDYLCLMPCQQWKGRVLQQRSYNPKPFRRWHSYAWERPIVHHNHNKHTRACTRPSHLLMLWNISSTRWVSWWAVTTSIMRWSSIACAHATHKPRWAGYCRVHQNTATDSVKCKSTSHNWMHYCPGTVQQKVANVKKPITYNL